MPLMVNVLSLEPMSAFEGFSVIRPDDGIGKALTGLWSTEEWFGRFQHKLYLGLGMLWW